MYGKLFRIQHLFPALFVNTNRIKFIFPSQNTLIVTVISPLVKQSLCHVIHNNQASVYCVEWWLQYKCSAFQPHFNRANINTGEALLILIYNRIRLSFLILFAAATQPPPWDFISCTPHICHGHNTVLLFYSLFKKDYLRQWRMSYTSVAVLTLTTFMNILSVFIFLSNHQQFYSIWVSEASGENSFIEWIQWRLICGWRGPCRAVHVGSWQT